MTTRAQEGHAVPPEVPPPGGYVIGIQEVYQELRDLGLRLQEYIGRQDAQLATVQLRLTNAERDLAELQAQLEAERGQRAATHRQAVFAVLSSLLFPLLVALVTAALIR